MEKWYSRKEPSQQRVGLLLPLLSQLDLRYRKLTSQKLILIDGFLPKSRKSTNTILSNFQLLNRKLVTFSPWSIAPPLFQTSTAFSDPSSLSLALSVAHILPIYFFCPICTILAYSRSLVGLEPST